MPITLAEFSRKKTLSLRLSMAKALRDYLASALFPDPTGPTKFAAVYDEWPRSDDRFVTPAACVLGPMTYADARLTPTLLEETWEIRGEQGFGLYALADAESDFEVQVRAPTTKERDDVVSGFETLFVEDSVLMNHIQGRRYGRLINMPTYFGLDARYSLQSQRLLDDADAAIKNRREVSFVVRVQAKQVKVDRVSPFSLTVREVVDGAPA